MKIGLLGFNKIKYMPYINFYLENLDREHNEIHVLYWNRDLQEENLDKYSKCVFHEFKSYQEDDVSKLSKIGNFVKYRKFAKKVINKEKFDLIIILHSLPGVITSDILSKRYKGKYIFDYRDSTYEGFAPYKKLIGNIVKGSSATFVSSDAFRRFLPEDCADKIYTSHNILMDSLAHRDEKQKYGDGSDKIRIAFWGFIRHEEINREIIKKIAADARFELHYYGREQQVALNLKQYTKELEAKNIFFHGEYKPEDRYEFVRHTDVIHNVYKDSNMMLAMGNKYYDAVIFGIPLMSTQGSFMAEMAERANVGLNVDPYEEDFTSRLYDAYNRINKDEFEEHCDRELQRVLSEYTRGAGIIKTLTSQ